jgi:hypothetical protein
MSNKAKFPRLDSGLYLVRHWNGAKTDRWKPDGFREIERGVKESSLGTKSSRRQDGTMDRLEGAVAGQLQCLVRWPRALRRKLFFRLKLFDVGGGKNELRQCRI